MDTRQHGAASSNKPLVFSKMESLVREMQDPETGIPIRPQKIFLTSIPSAFMGYDLIEWLMDRLDMEDSAEAIHLANLLCQYGYFFPVGETRSLIVKDDSSLYRFQTPYYWASQNHSADTTDYAIYLTKRLSRNKQKHGLEDYEVESYSKLKKGLQHKWDFVTMQAEEQVKLAKDRKKGDKIVTDSQERAYWRVYRPPPGFNNCLETAPVPDRANVANRVRKKTWEERKKEVKFYAEQISRTRMKASLALEGLISHFETYAEFDFLLVPPQPSNPFVSDDVTFWILNESIVEVPTEKRARRWAICFQELVSDQTGIGEFSNYLRKEYCHENIRFWQAVNELRYGSTAQIIEKVKKIFEEFLKPGAPCEINIDGKTMEATQLQMKTPTRHTYEAAAEHVYVLLLKKDCYPRFLRSEHYKNILANAAQPLQKKRFFSFGGPGKKKISAPIGTNSGGHLQTLTPQPLKRHGSDEHNAQTPISSFGMAHVTSDSSLPSQMHSRGECDPPYSAIERETPAEPADDVCPWDTSPAVTVAPPKGELPLVPKPAVEPKKPLDAEKNTQEKAKLQEETVFTEVPKVREPSAKALQQKPTKRKPDQTGRFHHTLPHLVPASHAKPPRPDRSQSVDVNPVSSRMAPGQLADIRPTLSLTTPANLHISDITGPPRESSKREQTSLAPSSTYMVTERRASEGCRLLLESKKIAVIPSWKETVHVEEVSAAEQEADVGKPKQSDCPGSRKTVGVKSPELRYQGSIKSPASDLVPRTIDYSVRSAHLPSQHGLVSSPSSPNVVTAEASVSYVEIRTSTAPYTVGTTTITSQPPVIIEHKTLKLDSVQSMAPNRTLASTSDSKKQSPKGKQKDGTWGENTAQKSTDVCPWEDEESCKVDAPYVKTYATLGYL